MAQLYHRNLKSRYHIRFINQYGNEEIGMDAGGLTKEFLTRLFKYPLPDAELPLTRDADGSSRTIGKNYCRILTIGVHRTVLLPASMSSLEDYWGNHCVRISCWG